ncbi:hypothetical protein [Wolbachia endosymbiont of Cantharis cryptica]|uniref:hypothetical protein n=1 Tax=Wolbachia endosymbiont of Cantharis cryptica TaxID=3066132 RepID=UPI00376F3B2B
MKVIYHTNGDTKLEESTKHVVHFFGMLGCIKFNALGKDLSVKQGGKFHIVKHYFDYPYFSRIVNPKLFQKELNEEEKKFNRRIISLYLCSAILSIASIVSLYLAYQNQKSKKVLTGLAFTSVVLSILTTVCFIAVCLWMFFDFVKEKFVVHRIKSFLENEVSPEWIKRYKKELVGDNQEVDAETYDQESAKNKDIEDIIEFLLERKKVVALYKFLTNGEKLVQAGMAMVNMLLVKGIHPNDIVLDTNSLGGGIAAEVLRRFEEQGIYLTLIHSNSYSSLKETVEGSPKSLVNWLPSMLLNRWFECCGLDLNSLEIVKKMKGPVLIVGRRGDEVIPEDMQLVGKLDDQRTDKTFRENVVLEHDPKIACENKIHIDYKEHLVRCEDNDGTGTIKYTSYKEIENQFLENAGKYLKENNLNGKFNRKDYEECYFSKNLREITLQSINGRSI